MVDPLSKRRVIAGKHWVSTYAVYAPKREETSRNRKCPQDRHFHGIRGAPGNELKRTETLIMRLSIATSILALIAAPAAGAEPKLERTVARHVRSIVPADGGGGVAVALRIGG